MWDLIVSVPGHCLSFYFEIKTEATKPVLSLTTERHRATPCWYCNGDHWNDQCSKYKTAEERKGIL